MAHGGPENNFAEPSKVAMPAWRTALVISYTVYLLLKDFLVGRVKKIFAGKSNSAVAKK